MSKIVIIGGGAAGMFASIFAAEKGNEVHLYDKNEKLGKKLYITGKGRCNLTNACDMETLFDSIRSNPKFMYSSLYACNNFDVIDFFEQAGLSTKIERGSRVFPVSDHSYDVINTLTREMKKRGVHIHLYQEVQDILTADGRAAGILLTDKQKISADQVIVATGGLSYQTTGSTGDGYEFARRLGHTITDLSPSLVPLEIEELFVRELQGLSLKNIAVTIYNGKKELFSDFGEMLFTHFGVSGPLILSASSFITGQTRNKPLKLIIDLKPALSEEQLDRRLIREFENIKNKQFKNAVSSLFPSKLIPVMVALGGINSDKKVNEVSREERLGFVSLIKHVELTITGFREFKEAVITRGGISVKEINPATMESKLVHGVYFIGEVLDLDALTGGFNLQIAWSTGYAAGKSLG